MHILFLSDNFPPETNAPASRTYEHCREWVKAGHRVTVITCAPNFPKGEVFGGYRNRLWQSEEKDGIRVIRVWSYITRNEGFARRITDYLSFMVTGFLASLFVRRVDVIIGTSPQFFVACAAWMASVFKWKPWIFELRDIWPESIRAVSAMESSRLLDALEKLELFLYRRANAVVSVTHAFKANLVSRGIDPDKIHVVTNGVDLSRFTPMDRDKALASQLGLEGCFVAGYIGTHGLAHGLDTLLEAAAQLAGHEDAADVRIILIGDGAQRQALMERAREMQLHNVVFQESVSKEEMPRYWSLLDVSIIHLKKDPLFTTVIPSKLFECMAMGLPVLHGVEGESAEIVEKTGVGETFEPGNPEALVAALRALRHDPQRLQRYREKGPEAAWGYDRRALAGRMLGVIEGVAGEDTAD